VGGLIIASELFGVNEHIRAVADSYAADGFLVLVPHFYDRYKPGSTFAYTPEGLEAARELLKLLDFDNVMMDVRGAVRTLTKENAGRIGMIGYCSGGTSSWLAAARVEGLACTVGYYGSNIPKLAAEQPKVPVMLHWGGHDHTVSLKEVRTFESVHPEVESYVYDTGHGFNCDMRAHHYHAPSSMQARARTLDFLSKNVVQAV